MTVTIYGDPVAKPRMSSSDKYKMRPCVMHYRAWCDLARYKAFGKNKKIQLTAPTILRVRIFLADGTRQHRVGPHGQKPDVSNILKAVEDALFLNDELIYDVHGTKLWADGGKARVEVEWTP